MESANSRNYTTISPSAKMVLLMKGLTDTPFAKEVADLLGYPENYIPEKAPEAFFFWIRVAHLEMRYKSIDTLLQDLPVQNVLELSSGFSFRGLDAVGKKNVHYIDTDLPNVIEEKKRMLASLADASTKGKLEILPLNALDEAGFVQVIDHFPDGPIAIVNEGLLMYLNKEEKKRLCTNIRKVLGQRGGSWITADIYFKTDFQIPVKDDLQKLLEEHDINKNRFENEAEAEDFFRGQGFIIDKALDLDITQSRAVEEIKKYLTPEMLASGEKPPKISVTWRLKLKGSGQSEINRRQET